MCPYRYDAGLVPNDDILPVLRTLPSVDNATLLRQWHVRIRLLRMGSA